MFAPPYQLGNKLHSSQMVAPDSLLNYCVGGLYFMKFVGTRSEHVGLDQPEGMKAIRNIRHCRMNFAVRCECSQPLEQAIGPVGEG